MLEIRRYQPSDNKVVKELNLAGLEQTSQDINWQYYHKAKSDFDDIEGMYINNRGDFLVGLEGDDIVAMGALKKSSDTCGEIKRVRVRRDRQRKGYGEQIMLKLIEVAEQLGYKELILDTLPSNLPAQRLFEKLGFKEVRRGTYDMFNVIYYGKKLNEEDK